MEQLVLTIIAPDQAGLVERIAQCVADHQGNWLGSHLSRMGGQFAGIVQVDVPSDASAALSQALQRLESQRIRVLVAPSGTESAVLGKTLTLALTGNDRPGIVRDISQVLAGLKVNVEWLSTQVQPAPMSNEPLFEARATLSLPEGLTLVTLQEQLERLADDLMVELHLSEA